MERRVWWAFFVGIVLGTVSTLALVGVLADGGEPTGTDSALTGGSSDDETAPPSVFAPETTTPDVSRPQLVHVYRLDRNIPAATPGSQALSDGSIVATEIPREFLPANAVFVLDELDGLVALNDLSANQVLVEGMFVAPEHLDQP